MDSTLTVTMSWIAFFGAAAGAAAALGGLIIVAMSVNIEVIIKSPSMPARAGSTIASLVLAVVVALAALMPGQSLPWLGIEVIVFSLIAAAMHSLEAWQIIKLHRSALETLLKVLLGLVPVLAFIVGGVLLLFGSAAGMYWIAAGTLFVFVGSVVNAWVLLVEIRR